MYVCVCVYRSVCVGTAILEKRAVKMDGAMNAPSVETERQT